METNNDNQYHNITKYFLHTYKDYGSHLFMILSFVI